MSRILKAIDELIFPRQRKCDYDPMAWFDELESMSTRENT
jgi:hypothetical protein